MQSVNRFIVQNSKLNDNNRPGSILLFFNGLSSATIASSVRAAATAAASPEDELTESSFDSAILTFEVQLIINNVINFLNVTPTPLIS